MRPKERRETGEHDLFRSRLDQIIDLEHALVKLARAIDWRFLEQQFGAAYSDKPGHPPLPTRLMAGLAILKHSYDLSDEALCERWVENPYFQYFCGEEFFQHRLVFDRSSLTRWRQRMGEQKLVALIQESLATAARTGAIKPSDLCRVVVDTTVQEKAVMFPTDARLINRARERLVRQAQQCGVRLRQSYRRVGKLALIKHQRYAHAKQFKRANRALRKLRTYLGRVIRDIRRNTVGNERMHDAFLRPLYLAERVLLQDRRQRGRKVYSLHAPRLNASARARRIAPMSSASRSASPPRSSIPPAANLSPTLPRCPAILTTATPWPRSSRRSRRSSAMCSTASSPMPAIAATTPRLITSSRSIPQAKSAGSPSRSNATSSDAPLSSRSLAISRTTTAWAAIISPIRAAMPSTQSSPPQPTTSAPHRLAEAFAAPNPALLQSRRSAQISLKSAFFTDDDDTEPHS